MPVLRLARRLFWDQWRLIDDEVAAEARSVEAESASDTTGKANAAGARAGRGAPDKGRKRGRQGQRGAQRKRGEAEGLAPAKALTPTKASAKAGFDWRVIVILITVSVSLGLQEYYGERAYFQKLFPYQAPDSYWTLKSYAWWSGWRVFGYVILPAFTILCMPGERLRDYFISPRGFFRHLWIYVVLYLLILPAVIIASQTDSFSRTYPFYKLANRSGFDFWAWQALYAIQFVALEFFFRGYMLRGLGRSMGAKAIFVMSVPYCMIHFGKPFPETMGAIGAGIILGTLAMRTKSIWGGIVIHIGVALTMDLLALGHCPPAETGQPCRGH
ncbi:lysostaphin resistance A-like protein [Haliangium sp.]|uniref:CPBP family intramembrane glutamic endopeptidase n=1 Tax=Haliangium sp. TaxID=2663208 RepID=UPI003D148D2C